MKKITLFLLSAILTSFATAQVGKPAIPRNEQIEQRVEEILSRMTLEEKIGQMCEITIDVISDLKKSYQDNRFTVDKKALQKVISQYKVGSILNVPMGVAQTPETWQELIEQIQEVSMKDIGIPNIYGVDQIHGATYTSGSTFFPQGINMAASFNRALVRRGAEISAYESKAGSIPWVYAPEMSCARDPRWSRMWEGYGEDTYLNAEMARQAVLGFQGEDPNHIGANHVAACIKHYMGYGVPISGKDRTPAIISEQDLREKHFAPFKACIEAGALSLMVNSALINGLPVHADKVLLTDWLKNQLNWDGMIVTDWADINNVALRDHIAKNKKDAIRICINAGIDMSMVPYDLEFCDMLKELVLENEVSMQRIDDAVRRILRLKLRLNLWEKPSYQRKDYPKFASAEFAETALQAALESQVLLKNEDVLPLCKGQKILVCGPNANTMRSLNGGWSYSWQGDQADRYGESYNTILEAMRQQFGQENILYAPGVSYKTGHGINWYEEETPDYPAVEQLAVQADVILCCVGENSYCETPGNLPGGDYDLNLSPNQQTLVKKMAATGKPVIMALSEGRPRIVRELVPLVQAVVNMMLPGNYGGDALARLLSGDANFSAKLPFTYPRQINGLATYDYKPSESMGQMNGNYNYDSVMDVEWRFGDGISYTTYNYSNFRVDKPAFSPQDELTFMIDVTNTGKVAGKEPVLLFSRDLIACLTPDNCRLRQFDKVSLIPGQTKTVVLKINASDLAFVGRDGKWILEKGDFIMTCGNQTLNISCKDTKKWENPNRYD